MIDACEAICRHLALFVRKCLCGLSVAVFPAYGRIFPEGAVTGRLRPSRHGWGLERVTAGSADHRAAAGGGSAGSVRADGESCCRHWTFLTCRQVAGPVRQRPILTRLVIQVTVQMSDWLSPDLESATGRSVTLGGPVCAGRSPGHSYGLFTVMVFVEQPAEPTPKGKPCHILVHGPDCQESDLCREAGGILCLSRKADRNANEGG